MSAQLFKNTTDVFHWNLRNNENRFIGNQGGTSSSKTISLLQILVVKAITEHAEITVLGQDVPNLKQGALRDFQNIVLPGITDKNVLALFANYNKTDRIYTLPNGGFLEFVSRKDWQDAKSGKRDYLFVNEANGIPYPIVEQMVQRTRRQVYFDWNPDAEFWYHEHYKSDPRCITYYSNFNHNAYLPETILSDILSWRDKNPRKYQIYGLGKTGRLEGLIYPNFSIVPELPFIFDHKVYGLDFGFGDPMALGDFRTYNDNLFCRELFYESLHTVAEMDRKIGKYIDKKIPMICDNSRPESIKELKYLGYNAIGVEKPKGSIISGIESVNQYKLHYAQDSTNALKEVRLYVREYDKIAGKYLDQPLDMDNHFMDAKRYAVMYLANQTRYRKKTKYASLPAQGY